MLMLPWQRHSYTFASYHGLYGSKSKPWCKLWDLITCIGVVSQTVTSFHTEATCLQSGKAGRRQEKGKWELFSQPVSLRTGSYCEKYTLLNCLLYYEWLHLSFLNQIKDHSESKFQLESKYSRPVMLSETKNSCTKLDLHYFSYFFPYCFFLCFSVFLLLSSLLHSVVSGPLPFLPGNFIFFSVYFILFCVYVRMTECMSVYLPCVL